MDTITKARSLAPSSPMLHGTAGLMLHVMRRHREAIATGESVVVLHPEFAGRHVMLGLAYEADVQFDRAIKAFETAIELEEHACALAALGHAHATVGNRQGAHAMLSKLRNLAKAEVVSPYFKALIHAGLGNVDEASNCLWRAHAEGCDWLIHAGVEPRWDNLRNCDAFQSLLAKIGVRDLSR